MHSHEDEFEDNKFPLGLLENQGVTLFIGEVDEERCSELIRWILEENLQTRHDQLTIIINSPGGDVTSGLAVIDVMAGSKIPIRTVGIGILASMGLLIFIAGKKGNRILTPNTLVMSHQWEGGLFGKEHELLAGVKCNTLISNMIINHYKKHTGLSVKKIQKHLLPPSDTYLTAKEALELNLCDQVKLV